MARLFEIDFSAANRNGFPRQLTVVYEVLDVDMPNRFWIQDERGLPVEYLGPGKYLTPEGTVLYSDHDQSP